MSIRSISIYVRYPVDRNRHVYSLSILSRGVFEVGDLLVCYRALQILLVILGVSSVVFYFKHLIREVLQIVSLNLGFHSHYLEHDVVDVEFTTEDLFLLLLNFVREPD